MRMKLIKKCNTIYLIYTAILALVLVFCLLNKQTFKSYFGYIFIGLVAFSFIFMTIFHTYENNCDKKIINKMVLEGKMALARIDHAQFEKFHKDSALKRFVIWKLDITYYDNNYKEHKETIFEQFAPLQESVPQGNIYITYDENEPDCKFIVPNLLVGAYDSNKDLILNYEKKFKNIKYLNVYYNRGLVVETFAESLKKKKADYDAKMDYEKSKEEEEKK